MDFMRENIDVVADCFRAWDRGDPDGVVANYAADVELDASALLEGVYRGRDAVREYFRTIFESFTFANEDLDLIPAGAQVVAITTIRGMGTASEAAVEARFGYVFTVADGCVRRVRLYSDPNEALAAAGVQR
jgi:ketosteroid isomerase-like protein